MLELDQCITETRFEDLEVLLEKFLSEFKYDDSIKSYITIYTILLQKLKEVAKLNDQNENMKLIVQEVLKDRSNGNK